jgi:hypothetical protein
LGARVFKVLPNGRRKTLPDGSVVIDQDALGFNVIYQYDPLADFADFFSHLTPLQQAFVRTFARYLKNPESLKEPYLSEKLKYLNAPPEYRKTVLGGAFSIEKVLAIRNRLLQGDLLEHVTKARAAEEATKASLKRT